MVTTDSLEMAEKPQGTNKRRSKSTTASTSSKEIILIQKPSFNKHKYFLGLLALATTVFLWVSSSFVMSYLLRFYPKAFFSTYVSTSTFQLYFLILYISYLLKKSNTQANANVITPQKLPKREIMKHATQFFLLYFISCYLANLAFEYTDVVSASILLSTSCFFTLIFSLFAGFETFTIMKGFSVLICAGGLCIVGLLSYIYEELDFQVNPPPNIMRGNLFAILSALLYGAYSVMLKKKAIDESQINMPFFFGCVGLLSTTLLWPFLLIFQYTGLEVLELPSLKGIALLFANNIFGSLAANYCWIYAILYTSPLIVSIGLAFSIPLTLIFDILINGNGILHFRSLAGIFILLAFVILNMTSIYPEFDYFFERSSFFKINKSTDNSVL